MKASYSARVEHSFSGPWQGRIHVTRLRGDGLIGGEHQPEYLDD